MNLYALVKFLHIVAVIITVGGLFARQLVRRHAKKAVEVHWFATYSQAAGVIETAMVIPGQMAIIVLGVILALIGGYPILGFLQGASQNWLLASNILLIGILALVPTVFIPRGKRFEPVLQAALAKGEMTPELSRMMEDPAVKFAHLYEEVALIVVVALMVLKPF
jgi:uncharacterized membrane protein